MGNTDRNERLARLHAREADPPTRTAIELCATCGGWISIAGTYELTPFETDGVTVVVRLAGDQAGHAYGPEGGCNCERLPAGELAARLRAEERATLARRFPARPLLVCDVDDCADPTHRHRPIPDLWPPDLFRPRA